MLFFLLSAVFHRSFPQDANASNQLSWNYTRDISIINPGLKVTDAVVEIELDNKNFDYSNAKDNGADIRFSTNTKEIKDAGLPYWIEHWNKDGISRIWVKIPKLAKNKNPG